MSESEKKRRQRRSFSPEFKAGAVKLVLEEGKSVAEVAKDLDLTETAFRRWVEQAKTDKGRGKPGALTSEERAELSGLRKRVRQLEMERDLLKNAAAHSMSRRNRSCPSLGAVHAEVAPRLFCGAEGRNLEAVEGRAVPE